MRDGGGSAGAGGTHRLEMIDVREKAPTRRRAVACGRIRMSRAAFEAIEGGRQDRPLGEPAARTRGGATTCGGPRA
jgi:molybdenum cofactor biosynthesis enzyme